jgi:hypothetical protein
LTITADKAFGNLFAIKKKITFFHGKHISFPCRIVTIFDDNDGAEKEKFFPIPLVRLHGSAKPGKSKDLLRILVMPLCCPGETIEFERNNRARRQLLMFYA